MLTFNFHADFQVSVTIKYMGKEKTMEFKINMLSWFCNLLAEAHLFKISYLMRYHRMFIISQPFWRTKAISEICSS